MTERQERMLRIERTFDAPADAVFEAWTSEEVLRRWLHAQPDWDTPIAEVDLRVGGSVRVVMRDPATLLPLTPAMFHVLLSLSDADRHGYAILKEVAERAVALSTGRDQAPSLSLRDIPIERSAGGCRL